MDIATATGGTATQDLGANIPYTVDYSDQMEDGDSITEAFWSAGDLKIGKSTNTGTSATAWLSGTIGETWNLVSSLVTMASGSVLTRTFRVFLRTSADIGAGIVSCFPNLMGAVATLRRDRLVVASRNYLSGVDAEDDYLLEKLVAAEALTQRELRVYFTPREIVPEVASADEVAALRAGGNVVAFEPGYDFEPSFFRGDSWGALQTRQRPIISLHSIKFAYPSATNPIFSIPEVWFRTDKKYGMINLVPVVVGAALGLDSMLLSALGGGRTIPLMVQVRYRAGLENAALDFPDLLDVIKKRAVLSIIEDAFNPTSMSDSADGLSQSLSSDVEKLEKTIDRKLAVLRQGIYGITLAVV